MNERARGLRRGRTYRHVTSRADKRIGHRIDQLPGYAKITNLDLARAVNQNVAWFYVAMHYSVFVSQVTQAFQYLNRKSAT